MTRDIFCLGEALRWCRLAADQGYGIEWEAAIKKPPVVALRWVASLVCLRGQPGIDRVQRLEDSFDHGCLRGEQRTSETASPVVFKIKESPTGRGFALYMQSITTADLLK